MYFARVHKVTKEVLQVHLVDDVNCINTKGKQPNEAAGIAYLKKVHKNKSWINDVVFMQTDKGGARKNFAGIGYKWDTENKGFVPKKPAASFVLNTSTLKWEPPLEMPKDGKKYYWDEKTQTWKVVP